MIESFCFETFAQLVGDGFRLRLDTGATLGLRLEDASRRGEPHQPQARAPFSLLFRGPGSPILPQRIYSLEHEVLGTFELFIVPLTPDRAGARYEAVFG